MTTLRVIALAGSLVFLFAPAFTGTATAGETVATPVCTETEAGSLETAESAAGALEAAGGDETLACLEERSDATELAGLGQLPIDDLLDRAAICRLLPECWVNADCDAQCGGAGLGRCAHSRCPVRVCRCK